MFTLEDLKNVTPQRICETYDDIPHPDIAKAKAGETISCRFQSLFSSEYMKLMASATSSSGKPIAWRMSNMSSILVAHCWVDASNNRVMPDDKMVLQDFWKQTSPGFLESMVNAAREICSVVASDDEDEEDSKNAESPETEGTE